MTSCKLLVYYPDDLRIVSGTIQNENPLIIKPAITADELAHSVRTKLRWYEGDISKYALVELSDGENGEFKAEILSEKTESDDSHFIEYREYFEVIKADPAKTGEFKHRTDKINNRYRSSLATHVKKILTDETLTNQYIFKLLLQIDEKMDQLLDTLKQEEAIEGLTPTKMLSFGGGGLMFLYEGTDMQEGDIVYIQSLPKGGTGINFAALCRVNEIFETNGRQICEAGYEYIDETTRETIIHYIFQKEREQLKRKN